MSNGVKNTRYAQAINANPMSLYTPDSIFRANLMTPVYGDMYIPSRPLDNRTLDKYETPDPSSPMWTTNKQIGLAAGVAYGIIGVLTRGKSIKATGKLLMNIGNKIFGGINRFRTSIANYIIDNNYYRR